MRIVLKMSYGIDVVKEVTANQKLTLTLARMQSTPWHLRRAVVFFEVPNVAHWYAVKFQEDQDTLDCLEVDLVRKVFFRSRIRISNLVCMKAVYGAIPRRRPFKENIQDGAQLQNIMDRLIEEGYVRSNGWPTVS
jgi:hypothetical protein